MGFTDAVKGDMLNLLDARATHASLHTADPGGTGASEVTGGSYTRQAITWQPAAAGSKTLTGSVTFQIPAGTTITHAGLWNAASSGTFAGGQALPASESYGAAGTYTLSLTTTI